MPDYRLVDLRTDDRLPAALEGESRIGVDTEFVREKTFHAQLCLIQLATPEKIYCADPLGLDAADQDGNTALWQTITRPAWVLHSGRQDLEVIYQAAGILPRDIFDTQVAAALLGYQPQIGYAGLVRELFGIELAKTHTRADWSRRPLPDAFIEYAAEDVQHLLPAYEKLTARLDDLGRLDWAIEDSRSLLDTGLYRFEPAQAIDRLKGARKLRGRARAAAAGLAAWREREALRRNRPRQWILRDAVLLDIAVKEPESRRQLAAIPGLAERTVARAGERLLRVLAEARRDPSDYEPPPVPDERQKAMLGKMQRLVADAALSLSVAAELIAPKKDLSSALLGNRDLRVFRGWRRDCIGRELLAQLENG